MFYKGLKFDSNHTLYKSEKHTYTYHANTQSVIIAFTIIIAMEYIVKGHQRLFNYFKQMPKERASVIADTVYIF